MRHTGGSLRAVLNTSPIIVLSRLGYLRKALQLIFEDAEIPKGVLTELERKKDSLLEDVARLVDEGLIKIEDFVKAYPRLGIGESSAIHLAYEKRKVVVLDDRRARRMARELGLDVIGTLSLLRRLHELGELETSPEELYMHLTRLGFYVSRHVFEKVFGLSNHS